MYFGKIIVSERWSWLFLISNMIWAKIRDSLRPQHQRHIQPFGGWNTSPGYAWNPVSAACRAKIVFHKMNKILFCCAWYLNGTHGTRKLCPFCVFCLLIQLTKFWSLCKTFLLKSRWLAPAEQTHEKQFPCPFGLFKARKMYWCFATLTLEKRWILGWLSAGHTVTLKDAYFDHKVNCRNLNRVSR